MTTGVMFGVLLGATVGLAVGHLGQRLGGSCPIACNPYGGAIFGAVIGGLIAGMVPPGKPSYTPSPHLLLIENAEGFQKEVIEADGPVLADFYATRCPPCKRMEPTVHALADRFAGRAHVAKVNVDKLNDIARKYRIKAIPTLIVFVDGREVERTVGYQPEAKLGALLERHAPAPAS